MSTLLLEILPASIIPMIVGIIWYSKFAFGREWKKLSKIKEEPNTTKQVEKYIITYFVSLISAYVLSKIVLLLRLRNFGEGALLGYWLWIGIRASFTLPGYLLENKPLKLFLIDTGKDLASIVLMCGYMAQV